MIKFRRLVLALLALLATTFPQAAFAAGKSNTPNPIDEHADFLFDFVGTAPADHYILEEAHDHFKAFAAWCFASPQCDYNLFLTKVRSGASHTVAAGTGADAGDTVATWTGTIFTFPIGNVRANAYPIVACSSAPCTKPAWVPAGVNVIYNGTSPGSDTALATVQTSFYASRVALSAKYQTPIEVEETDRTGSESPLKKSGRIFLINPYIWPDLTLEAQYAWVARAIMIALNAPLQVRPSTDVSFLQPTGPDVYASGASLVVPSLDITALDGAGACFTPGHSYTSFPVCAAPVP